MATEWYYAQDGRQHGPVAARELKKLAESGALRPTDLVWKEGLADWTPAGQVKGLLTPAPAREAEVPVVVPEAESFSSGRPRSRYRSQLGPILLVVAALMMIGSAFSPWWSIRFAADQNEENDQRGKWATSLARVMNESQSQLKSQLRRVKEHPQTFPDDEAKRRFENAVRFLEVAGRNKKWWDAHLKTGEDSFAQRFDKAARKVDDEERTSLTMRIWGWNEGIGIMGLVFGLFVLIPAIVFASVPVLRNWSWTVSIVATIMGIVALVAALIWVIKAPGEDVVRLLSQGTIVGPYLLLGSAAMYFLVGLFDTILGATFLARSLRRG